MAVMIANAWIVLDFQNNRSCVQSSLLFAALCSGQGRGEYFTKEETEPLTPGLTADQRGSWFWIQVFVLHAH